MTSTDAPGEPAATAATSMHPAAATAIAVEKALARLPTYGSAYITTDEHGVSTITASLSARSDLSKSTKKFEQSYSIDADGNILHTSQLVPVSDEVTASALSPSGKWRINLRSVEKNEQTGAKRIVEIVSATNGIVAEVDVTDSHSTFLDGGMLACTGTPRSISVLSLICRHMGQPRLARYGAIPGLCRRAASTALEQ